MVDVVTRMCDGGGCGDGTWRQGVQGTCLRSEVVRWRGDQGSWRWGQGHGGDYTVKVLMIAGVAWDALVCMHIMGLNGWQWGRRPREGVVYGGAGVCGLLAVTTQIGGVDGRWWWRDTGALHRDGAPDMGLSGHW